MGLSVNIEYYDPYDVSIGKNFPELLFSTVEFADSSKQWLSGVPGSDGSSQGTGLDLEQQKRVRIMQPILVSVMIRIYIMILWER